MLTLLITILGLVTVFLSVKVALKFRNYTSNLIGDSKGLTKALSLQLWGEAIIGLGTLVFAILAHLNMLSGISDDTQSLIRLLMFFATSTTTLHLSRIVSKIHG
mgnify:CR=1 FL=1